MTFAEKLKRLTENHHIPRLAKAAHVSAETIRRSSRGEYKPRRATITVLAQALNVDAGWMADDSRDWPPVWVHREGRVAAVS